jgi:tetratricopeptide (TPR) repeat protein
MGILTKGQWRLHAVLAVIFGVVVVTSLYMTGRAPQEGTFPRTFQGVLIAHLVAGHVVLLLGAAFVLWHLPRALRTRNGRSILVGLGLTLLAVAAVLSGSALVQGGAADRAQVARIVHSLTALLVPFAYLLHRRLGAGKASPLPWLLAVGSAVACGLAAIGHPRTIAAVTQKSVPEIDPFVPWTDVPGAPRATDPFYPSSARTVSGNPAPDAAILLPEGEAPGVSNCRRCHADIAEQWESSAHRLSSFENPFYAVSVEALRKDPKDGVKRARWCAGCHDPAVMLTGRWEQPVERTETHSRAGLTCLACHAIEKLHDVGGNGGYFLRDDPTDPYIFAETALGVHDKLLQAYPAVHKRQMLKAELHRTSEFCSTCHKVSLEAAVNDYRWIRGQDEYDAWHSSGVNQARAATFYLPPDRKVCQDCHMPLEVARKGDLAAKNGFVKSHRFAAANSGLPFVRKDAEQLKLVESFLKGACRLDVFALANGSDVIAPLDSARPAGDFELHVVVRNKGVGHAFPGGTVDSNEVWLQVTAEDESGKKVLDDAGHVYKALFLDEKGGTIDKRNPQDIRAKVFARTIGPSKSDMARYHLALTGKTKVTARLFYRKFTKQYTDYAGTPEVPPVLVAERSLTLGEDSKVDIPLWERWNDYGVALLDQNDTRAAARAFEEVSRLAPSRPDGPRNLARTALQDGRVEEALEHLADSEKRAPGDAQSAFFWGEALARTNRLEDAASAYTRALERFPLDREARRGLAEVRWKQVDSPQSLLRARAAFLDVLAIDPEDRGAHYRRMLTYRDDPQMEAEARKAYERYRDDEEMKARVTEYLVSHADANRELQPLHVH